MRNFQLSSKVMQKGSKDSVNLLGLLPYTQSLHQTFTIYISSSILTTGTLLFSSASILYLQLLTCFFHVHQYHQMDFVETKKISRILFFYLQGNTLLFSYISAPQELFFMSGWSCSHTYFKHHLRHR